jgi:hypothetical protein
MRRMFVGNEMLSMIRRVTNPILSFALILSALVSGQAYILASSQIAAATIRVAPTGNDTSGCGSEGSPCQTIQYAINQAESGDTILIAGGTYTYNSSADICSQPLGTTAVACIVNKQLTILGGYSAEDWSDVDPSANVTIIDGEEEYRGVFVLKTDSTSSLHMEGFTIRRGLAQGNPKRPGNDKIFAFGGGMLVENSQVTLRNITFEDNLAIGENTDSAYGGAGSGGGLALRNTSSDINLVHITFEDNLSEGGTGPDRGGLALGGGLYTYKTVVSGQYITFTNNVAMAGSSNGDGFYKMHADAQGGAAAFQADSDVVFQDVRATSNIALGGYAPNGNAGGAFGGAFFTEDAALILRDIEVFANMAQGGEGRNDGSTAGASYARGGGIAITDSDFTLDRATVISNTAIGGDGTVGRGSAAGGGIGVVRTYGDFSAEIINCIISDNSIQIGNGTNIVGGGGGGLWLQGADADIVHTTFSQNRLQGSTTQGQAIVLLNFGSPTPAIANISYSIIADHTNSFGAAAIHVQPENTANLHRGLFAGNTKDTNADGVPASAGVFNGLDSMLDAASANFVSPGSTNYDYHILGSSAAKDQATGSTTLQDIDGESRPIGDASDIGADECLLPSPDISTSSKSLIPSVIRSSEEPTHLVTYVIRLRNTGDGDIATGTLTDTLSTTNDSISLNLSSGPFCTGGTCDFDDGSRVISWSGSISTGEQMDISYVVGVTIPTDFTDTVSISNIANFDYTDSRGESGEHVLNAYLIVNAKQVYLPFVMR